MLVMHQSVLTAAGMDAGGHVSPSTLGLIKVSVSLYLSIYAPSTPFLFHLLPIPSRVCSNDKDLSS